MGQGLGLPSFFSHVKLSVFKMAEFMAEMTSFITIIISIPLLGQITCHFFTSVGQDKMHI